MAKTLILITNGQPITTAGATDQLEPQSEQTLMVSVTVDLALVPHKNESRKAHPGFQP